MCPLVDLGAPSSGLQNQWQEETKTFPDEFKSCTCSSTPKQTGISKHRLSICYIIKTKRRTIQANLPSGANGAHGGKSGKTELLLETNK